MLRPSPRHTDSRMTTVSKGSSSGGSKVARASKRTASNSEDPIPLDISEDSESEDPWGDGEESFKIMAGSSDNEEGDMESSHMEQEDSRMSLESSHLEDSRMSLEDDESEVTEADLMALTLAKAGSAARVATPLVQEVVPTGRGESSDKTAITESRHARAAKKHERLANVAGITAENLELISQSIRLQMELDGLLMRPTRKPARAGRPAPDAAAAM